VRVRLPVRPLAAGEGRERLVETEIGGVGEHARIVAQNSRGARGFGSRHRLISVSSFETLPRGGDQAHRTLRPRPDGNPRSRHSVPGRTGDGAHPRGFRKTDSGDFTLRNPLLRRCDGGGTAGWTWAAWAGRL